MEQIEEKVEEFGMKINPKKDVPVPDMPFEVWYKSKNFQKVKDFMLEKEWTQIYSNYYSFDGGQLEIDLNETDEEIENYDIKRQTKEYVRCANDFYYFCTKYLKINHPIHGLINFIPYNYQKRVISCYESHRFNILSKFRQGGLTTVSVMWTLWRCMFKTDQRIMLISKTDREAISAGDMARVAIQYLPSWLKPEMDKFNEHEKQFNSTNSIFWCYTAEAARGKSITILILDEAAFIPDMHSHWKAIYPVISTGGSCEVVSTVNGIGNWYEETYHEALAGKNRFNIIDIDYWEHPAYNDPNWVRDTRENLGEKGWAQEVERSFLGTGDTWLKSNFISNLIKSTKDKIPLRMKFDQWKNKNSNKRYEYDDGALWIWNDPIEGHEYIIGVDCAEGVGDSGDNSAFQIIDKYTLEQAAEFYSNTVPPHIFALILHQIGTFYKEAEIVIENANIGAAVLNALQNEHHYENLFYEKEKNNFPGIKSTKSSRPQFLQTLQQRLMNNTLTVNSYRLVYELNSFVYNPITKKAEARRGNHDDLIISMALALYVRDLNEKNLPPIATSKEENMKIFSSDVYEQIRKEIINDEELENLFSIDKDNNYFNSNFALDQEIAKYKMSRSKILQEFGW